MMVASICHIAIWFQGSLLYNWKEKGCVRSCVSVTPLQFGERDGFAKIKLLEVAKIEHDDKSHEYVGNM